jgi:hypothetical protein
VISLSAVVHDIFVHRPPLRRHTALAGATGRAAVRSAEFSAAALSRFYVGKRFADNRAHFMGCTAGLMANQKLRRPPFP